jgi:hypothetical protein
MSYNPTLIKIIEIDALIIPLSALVPEDGEWTATEMHDTNGQTTYQFAECSEIQGDVLGEESLQVNSFDCTGECSGSCMREVFEPAFKESTGKLVAVVIWEGGDSVQTLTVEGGKVTWGNYEFCVERKASDADVKKRVLSILSDWRKTPLLEAGSFQHFLLDKLSS